MRPDNQNFFSKLSGPNLTVECDIYRKMIFTGTKKAADISEIDGNAVLEVA